MRESACLPWNWAQLDEMKSSVNKSPGTKKSALINLTIVLTNRNVKYLTPQIAQLFYSRIFHLIR